MDRRAVRSGGRKAEELAKLVGDSTRSFGDTPPKHMQDMQDIYLLSNLNAKLARRSQHDGKDPEGVLRKVLRKPRRGRREEKATRLTQSQGGCGILFCCFCIWYTLQRIDTPHAPARSARRRQQSCQIQSLHSLSRPCPLARQLCMRVECQSGNETLD